MPGRSSELQRLARLLGDEPRTALPRLLALVCELLELDVAFVAGVTPRSRLVVRVAVRADGRPVPEVEGRVAPLAQTWCGAVVARGGLVLRDATDDPQLAALASTAELGIAACAGVPLHAADGTVVGTLCAFSTSPAPWLGERDHRLLREIAPVAAVLLTSLDAPVPAVPVPQQRSAEPPAAAPAGGRGVEAVTRPLLEVLQQLTGLASSYLTVVHEGQGLQEIRYARNTREDFALPEGLFVPWEDTLCKRALDEGRACTTDVPEVWGDSQAAADLGIQVYVSVPVHLADGQVWGTLCAADAARADQVEAHLPTMRLFARLIAAEVERTTALERERARAAAAESAAATDPLTGCASRRALQPWLDRTAGELAAGEVVALLYLDLDGFKAVNDTLGHAAGDAVLTAVGERLLGTARGRDLVVRLGGDEFVVAARVPERAAPALQRRLRDVLDFSLPWRGRVVGVRASVGLSTTADAELTSGLLDEADRAMYTDKRARTATV